MGPLDYLAARTSSVFARPGRNHRSRVAQVDGTHIHLVFGELREEFAKQEEFVFKTLWPTEPNP